MNECMRGKVFLLQTMKAQGVVDARVHIYTATVLERGRMASPKLGCLYPLGKLPGLLL